MPIDQEALERARAACDYLELAEEHGANPRAFDRLVERLSAANAATHVVALPRLTRPRLEGVAVGLELGRHARGNWQTSETPNSNSLDIAVTDCSRGDRVR